MCVHRGAAVDGFQPFGADRRYSFLVLEDTVDDQEWLADDGHLFAIEKIGRMMTLEMPVSSSSVRNTNPFAVPGRCR